MERGENICEDTYKLINRSFVMTISSVKSNKHISLENIVFIQKVSWLDSSEEDKFRVTTPDETTGKETEFSLAGSLEIK